MKRSQGVSWIACLRSFLQSSYKQTQHRSSTRINIILKFQSFKKRNLRLLCTLPRGPIYSPVQPLIVDPNIRQAVCLQYLSKPCLVRPFRPSPTDIYTQALQAVILITTQQEITKPLAGQREEKNKVQRVEKKKKCNPKSPCPLWGVPCYRYPKRKRNKKKKNLIT